MSKIDWGALTHAYGSAEDVPEILAGLRSADPDVREWALDRFHMGVHHQSSVYDSTVASLPFLVETLLDPDAGDRPALAELIVSICAGLEPTTDDLVLRARAVLNGYLPRLRALLHDPALRPLAPRLLAGCADWWPWAVADLQPMIADRPDPELIDLAVGIVRQHTDPVTAAMFTIRLARLTLTGDAAGRLAALGGLLALDPGVLPGTLVDLVAAAAAECPDGDLCVRILGNLRDRPADSRALMLRLLASPDPQLRRRLAFSIPFHVNEWPGPHLELLSALLDAVVDPDAVVRRAALENLPELGTALAPLTERVLAVLDGCDRTTDAAAVLGDGWHVIGPWLDFSAHRPPFVGRLLRAAANTGDERVVPAVRWALELTDLPAGLDRLVAPLGARAAGLVPLIRRRIAELATGLPAALSAEAAERVRELARAIDAIGPPAAAAATELAALLDADSPALFALGWHHGPHELGSLIGRLGPDAAVAVPALRRLLSRPEPDVRLHAAGALWRITGDPGPLPTLLPEVLAGDREHHLAAIGLAGDLGAVDCVPLLLPLVDSAAPQLRVPAALALWRLTRQPEPTVRRLVAELAYHEPRPIVNVGLAWVVDIDVIDCLAEIGPAAAPARSHLERLRDDPRRTGPNDDARRAACRRAVAAIDA